MHTKGHFKKPMFKVLSTSHQPLFADDPRNMMGRVLAMHVTQVFYRVKCTTRSLRPNVILLSMVPTKLGDGKDHSYSLIGFGYESALA